MKSLRITAIIALVFAAFGFASAQDVETEATTVGSFVQFADAGSFEATETDGIYTLSLEGIGEQTAWQFASPEFDAGRYATNLLALHWGAIDDLATEAILETEDVVLTVALTSPSYDFETGVFTFEATVEEVNFAFENDDPKAVAEVPATFGESTLFISFNDAFLVSFDEGAAIAGAGVRDASTGNNCSRPRPCGNSAGAQ